MKGASNGYSGHTTTNRKCSFPIALTSNDNNDCAIMMIMIRVRLLEFAIRMGNLEREFNSVQFVSEIQLNSIQRERERERE